MLPVGAVLSAIIMSMSTPVLGGVTARTPTEVSSSRQPRGGRLARCQYERPAAFGRARRARRNFPCAFAAPPSLPVELTLISCSVAGGLAAKHTKLGARLTGALCSFGFACGLGNLGFLPASHGFYDLCWSSVLPTSLAVTVLGASAGPGDRSSSTPRGRRGGSALAFGAGACGSVLGAGLAFYLATGSGIKALEIPAPLAAQAAASLAATYGPSS